MAGGERPQFAGFALGDFDPAAWAIETAVTVATKDMSAERRIGLARRMQSYFRDLESHAAQQLGGAAGELREKGGR